MKFSSLIVLLLFVFSTLGVWAQDIPAPPNPPKLVNDFAGVLSPDEEARLEKILVAYDDTTSNQIAIVLVKTLGGYPIEEYSIQLFRKWGIGNKATNNGVLIIAAIDDRLIRIEPGYGLEGAIPDIVANQIIRGDIQPNFRRGDYYGGLNDAAASIIEAATGEYKAPEGYADRRRGEGDFNPLAMIIILIIIIIIFSRINKGGGGGFMSRRGYRGFGPTIFWPGGGGGGGGWSGGGGGGFGGFGGGSSGGGGASGSW